MNYNMMHAAWLRRASSIVECEVLNNTKVLEEIKYEKLINGTVAEKLKIAYKLEERKKGK